MSSKYGLQDGWRKLNKMKSGSTRILSLPYNIYRDLGFSKSDELMGRWVVVDGKLVLEMKKMEVTSDVS